MGLHRVTNRPSILIICRDVAALSQTGRFRQGDGQRLIVASDDPRVHEAAKAYAHIAETRWIEKIESFYNVAQDVIRLTSHVNAWLKSLADGQSGFPEQLLFFVRNVEGGMTTQRIQDLLLLVRSCGELLDATEAAKLVVIRRRNLNSQWEDDVFIKTAASRGIPVTIVDPLLIGALSRKVGFFAVLFLRALYYAANVLRLKCASGPGSKAGFRPDRQIAFQLCSSAKKHIDNIVPMMRALKACGYDPTALCWLSDERYVGNSGVDQIRAAGLRAEQLERDCGIGDIWRSVTAAFWTWRKAKAKKSEFLSLPALSYMSVPLGPLLWESIQFFLVAELPQSYRHFRALTAFFGRHPPAGLKLWGSADLREGVLAWKSLPRDKMPLIFFYVVGAYLEWPYDNPDNPVDLLFVAGEMHRRVAMKTNIRNDRIKVSGQPRYQGICDFKKSNTREQSSSYLRIPRQYSLRILYDSSAVMRGYFSSREQSTALSILLNFIATRPHTALLVKPHPSHHAGIVEDMIREKNVLRNVFLIGKSMSPYHALNAADMLITKCSALGVEAMLFDRPVICCLLDGEVRLNFFGNAVDVVTTERALLILLERVTADTDFRKAWERDHASRRQFFLADYFFEADEPPATRQAKILDEHLKKRRISSISAML